MPATTRLPSLLAEAEQRAHNEHSRRLAELKTLAPLLYHLDELRPELEARSLKLYTDTMRLSWHWPTGALGRRQKVLCMDTRGWEGDAKARRWYDALLGLGFREVKRADSPVYPTVVLERGHLLLQVDLPRDAAKPAEPAAEATHARAA